MTVVYTDGSCIPDTDGKMYAGIGIWFKRDDVRNTSLGVIAEYPTNQIAELLAVRYALRYCVNEPSVHIWSDSMYTINCITIWYKKWERNRWRSSSGADVKNKRIICDIVDIIRSRDSRTLITQFHHIRGHTGDIGNEGADILARIGSQISQGINVPKVAYTSSNELYNT